MTATATLPQTIPFTLGGASTTDSGVGLTYAVALGGIPFMLDRTVENPFTWGYLPTRKEQQDTSEEAGEQSLASGFWRRSRSSFHEGAGQEFLDGQDTSPWRFYASEGVDVWSKRKFSLLNDTERKVATTSSQPRIIRVGAYLYLRDGNTVKFTSDPTPASPSFTTATGLAGTIGELATDGTHIYIASNNASGTIYRSTAGTTGQTSWSTVANVDRIGVANGFFLASDTSGAIYVVDSAGTETAKTPGFITLMASATCVGFAQGPDGPYVGINAGAKGYVFRGVIADDGTLDHFILAAELPDGEHLTGIASYLGFLLLGVSQGVRVAPLDSTGTVIYGPLIDTDCEVTSFEAEDRFVWFGVSDPEGSLMDDDSGTYRMDLSTFTLPIRPAYASDLMSGVASDTVDSIATHSGKRFFTVSGSGDYGLYGQTDDKVASGFLRTGKLTWSTLGRKYLKKLVVEMEPLKGTVELQISVDGGAFESYGTYSSQNATEAEFIVEKAGRHFDLKFVLTRSSSDATLGPTITGWTGIGIPIVEQQRYFECFVANFDIEQNLDGQTVGYVGRALERLLQVQSLKDTSTPVAFQGPDWGVRQFDTYQTDTHQVSIEDATYIQTSAGGSEGFGGRIRFLLYEVR